MPGLLAATLVMSALAPGCGRETPGQSPPGAAGRPSRQGEPPATAAGPRVVFLGDSLTTGYGLAAGEAYPSLVQQRLRDAGLAAEVVNAGVSGDTSAGGLRRLDWALDGDVAVLVVALGGNDALRGLSTDDLRRNLAAIIERARGRGVTVVLAGMEAPPNLGKVYTSAFRQVYRDLAAEHHVALIPFLLEGVAGRPGLNQADLIHPNAEGARKVADLVWPFVERAVREAAHHD
ncbi:MAG: arylesterase [Rhodospirillaceae bacterium]